jgi:hypothetical protein
MQVHARVRVVIDQMSILLLAGSCRLSVGNSGGAVIAPKSMVARAIMAPFSLAGMSATQK